ncbi:MAG: lipid-binding protein [Rikenellaceae bacterium]
MKNIFKILALPLIALFALSCEKDDIGGTATESMAGEWVITAIECYDTDGNYYGEYCEYYDCTFSIYTFNTAANVEDEMWISDAGAGYFWYFQSKVDINQTTKTFSATDSEDLYYGITINFTDGVITTDGATSPTGMPTDAISFTAEFSDDPGYLYKYSGYRWSGFE